MGKIPAGTHPNMAEEVIITDANGEHLELTEDGKLPVEMTVNIEATIEESQMHGSTDGGTNWVPLKVGADGTLYVQLKGSYPEYRQLSTDPEPDAATAGKGATIYQIDTGIAKMSNGTAWEVL
jgi:hypothetical protein